MFEYKVKEISKAILMAESMVDHWHAYAKKMERHTDSYDKVIACGSRIRANYYKQYSICMKEVAKLAEIELLGLHYFRYSNEEMFTLAATLFDEAGELPNDENTWEILFYLAMAKDSIKNLQTT